MARCPGERRRWLITGLVGVVVALVPQVPFAPAATSTVVAAADAYVSQAAPRQKFGKAAELRVASTPALMSYLRFDVSGMSAPVTRVSLRLYAKAASPGGLEVVRVATSSWNENNLSWANRPATGARVGSIASVPAGWMSLDVTSAVTGNGSVSLALVGLTPSIATFTSREVAGSQPRLVVETASDTTAPVAPTALTATAGDGSVALDWADNTEPDLALYRVYRRAADGTWPTAPLAAVTTSASTDTDDRELHRDVAVELPADDQDGDPGQGRRPEEPGQLDGAHGRDAGQVEALRGEGDDHPGRDAAEDHGGERDADALGE